MILRFSITLLALAGLSSAQTTCDNTYVSYGNNTIGECDGCTGQLWIAQDCQSAFYCANDLPDDESMNDGCAISCPDGQIVLPNFVDNTWQCVDDDPMVANCYGAYHLRCPAQALLGPFDKDQCACDHELLVSSDCRYGMFCDKSQAVGAFFRDCGEDQIIDFDIRTWNWGCADDVGQCPGLGGYEIGCNPDSDIEVPLICTEYGMNTLGECGECDGQVFINEDCTQGFICTSNIPEDPNAGPREGCSRTCNDNEILVPDFAGGFWQCLPQDPNSQNCVGEFNINCPADDVGSNFDDDYCAQLEDAQQCDGAIVVSADCREAYKCNKDGGGVGVMCDEGEVVSIDVRSWNWGCSTDVGQCPGLGGFILGCGEGSPTAPTGPSCDVTRENPFEDRECKCEDQFFINDDCTAGFLCASGDPRDAGCYKECPTGFHLLPDFENRYWSCVEDDPTISNCPGRFSMECDPLPSPLTSDLCEVERQLIISDDCTEGFYCQKTAEGGGFYRKCDVAGETIEVNIRTWNWGCAESRNNCPGLGGFKVGGEDSGSELDTPQLICTGYSDNDIGYCDGCNNQVFINQDCSMGFICSDEIPEEQVTLGAQGCFHVCPDNQILVPRFGLESFECVDESEANCPGRFQTYCPSDPVPDTLDVSVCECEYEFLVTPDCKEAFLCDKRQTDGGSGLRCDNEGEIIQVDLNTWNLGCQVDTEPSRCPHLGGGFIIGCAEEPNELPLFCDAYSDNIFETECGGCDGQVFMNDDCSQGFICTSNLPVLGNEGCSKTCPDGTILVPDLENSRWDCVDPFEAQCLGGLQMYCPNNDIGAGFTDADCQCDEELLLSADCREAYRCSASGGESLTCADDEYVEIDFALRNWRCTPEESGFCPGLGGLRVGCPATYVTDEPNTSTAGPVDTTQGGGGQDTTADGKDSASVPAVATAVLLLAAIMVAVM